MTYNVFGGTLNLAQSIYRKQSHEVCMQHGVFCYGRSNGVTAMFVIIIIIIMSDDWK